MQRRNLYWFATIPAVLALIACGSKEDAGPPSPSPAVQKAPPTPPVESVEATPASHTATAPSPDLRAAKEFYAARCAACHGAKGTGDGEAAAQLDPKPRNYTDKAWQATITDEAIEAIILQGGAAMGKSPVMPPTPDLADKPELRRDVRLLIRAFGDS